MDLRENMPVAAAMSHWYYRSKFASLEKALPWTQLRSVLDFGCGRGVFARLLQQHHPHLEITAYDPNGADTTENGVRFVNQKPGYTFDAILLMDVLEHVPDPAALLAEVQSCCHTGTRVFVSVPAFQILWSGHDEYLGHYRRYNLQQLVALVTPTGFQIDRAHYLFSHLLLPALLRRRLLRSEVQSDMQMVPAWLNTLLYGVGFLESHIAPLNRLGGLTVVAQLRR